MNQAMMLTFILLIFNACSKFDDSIEESINKYYQVYNRREDIDSFMDFYDDAIVFEDIINGDRIYGKKNLRDFFDWDNDSFKTLDSNRLVISEKVIQNNKCVVKGYFTPFKWGQTEFEAMHFTTILTFNESKKIIKQVDWMNYPASLVNYSERKNSNSGIK